MTVLVEKCARGFLPQLNLDALGGDAFLAPTPTHVCDDLSRGLRGAQGLVAAGRTVDTDWRWVHSLHVTHLADGTAHEPVEYRVERLRDSDHLSTRLVRAAQGGALLATMTASFQVPRSSRAPTRHATASEDWPDPHTLPVTETIAALDIRHVDRLPRCPTAAAVPANRSWLRFTEEIPDRILLHSAAIVYAADLLLAGLPPGSERVTGDGRAAESLDLSVRFHAGFRADDWVRHEPELPVEANHRVLTSGRFYSSMGRLVASVSQESALLPASAADRETIVVNGPARGSRKE